MTKVKYNSENKNGIINNLNTCIDTLTTINNTFANTYIPYDYYYKNSLINLKYEITNIKKDLIEYKNNLNNTIEEINKDELELSSKLNKINDILIEKIDI